MPQRPTGFEKAQRKGRTVWRARIGHGDTRRRGPWRDSLGEAHNPAPGTARHDKRVMEDEAVRLGGRLPSDVTLAAFATEWFADAEAGVVRATAGRRYRPSTLRGYRRGWAKIEEKLGHRRMSAVLARDVQALVDEWLRGGAAPSTVRNNLDPLRAMYRRAIRLQLVPGNPTLDLDIPSDDSDEEEPMRFATREEAERLLGALEHDRALWATAFYAGLRRGELRALRVKHLDLDAGVIRVRRSWDDNEGEGPVKTKAGRRDVAIIEPLAAALREHLLATGRRGSPEALVFGRTASDPFVPSSVRQRALDAWEAAGLEPITLHQCRHTCASFMIAAGANAKALSVVLGHASISITFDRYGHLMPGGEDEVGRLLGAYIGAVADA